MSSPQCTAQDLTGTYCFAPADEHGDRHVNINGSWADGERIPLYLLVLTECDYTTADGPMSRSEALEEFRRLARYVNPRQGGRLRVMSEAEHERMATAPYASEVGGHGV